MNLYRCYFLDEADHIRAAEIIEGSVVAEVIEKALALLGERPQHRAVEVWEGVRRLYRSDTPERA